MKKFLVLVGILAVVGLAGFGISKAVSTGNEETSEEFTIVTSFYPTYIAVQNITDGIDNVRVVNLTENQSGCLHDYQLTTNDMRKLEGADVFIMNGGGMESFLDDVMKAYPDLVVIDASEGIALLGEIEGHDHAHEETHEHEEDVESHEEEEEHEHEHGDNAHVWMDPVRYLAQLQNITNGLSEEDKDNADAYAENLSVYTEKVNDIKDQLDALKLEEHKEVIIFHEAFAYLTDYVGLEAVYCLDLDEESGLSAGEIATVIDEVQEHDIKVLLTETEFKDSIATNISNETDAKVYVMTSLTSETDSKDAYIDGMQENINVLKTILADTI